MKHPEQHPEHLVRVERIDPTTRGGRAVREPQPNAAPEPIAEQGAPEPPAESQTTEAAEATEEREH